MKRSLVSAAADVRPDTVLASMSVPDTFANMVDMDNLTEDTMMQNISRRFGKDAIYTYTGAILVSVNPYKMLPLYTPEMIRKYAGQRLGDLPPHIFAIADEAYRTLVNDKKNQTILISGESGAGKTEATKLIIQYLASVASNHTWVEQQILEANPVLESFGNAKTVANDNSSRFGKFVEIHFDDNDHICGGRIEEYLLEKSRIVKQAPSERNFHVFYQLIKGASPQEKELLHLREPQDYAYLNQSGCTEIEGMDDAAEFLHMRKALAVLGIGPAIQLDIFRLVAAILHLGNIVFVATQELSEQGQEEDVAKITDLTALKVVAELMHVDAESLERALTVRKITIREQEFTIKLDVEKASDSRDALAKTLYARLFHWLVNRINQSLSDTHPESTSFIGVLDIFGFEAFDTNRFEQFAINYANEKFQQTFNRYIFQVEQNEYERDGLDWKEISFDDNTNCVDMLEKRPLGILYLLDEECRFPKGTDKSLMEKIKKHHKDNRDYSLPRMGQNIFNIQHYAGQVSYDITGFLEKNKDTFYPALTVLMQSSDDPFVCELFADPDNDPPADGDGVAAAAASKPQSSSVIGSATLALQFRDQLARLMETITATTPHYVRCVRPNDTKAAGRFMSDLVVRQLRYSGMLSTIKIRQQGYPVRLAFDLFLRRYAMLLWAETRAKAPASTTAAALVKSLQLPAGSYQVGSSKVFLRHQQYLVLEKRRDLARQAAADIITTQAKGYLARHHYKVLKDSTTAAQAQARGFIARRRFQQQRTAAITIQSTVRMLLARKAYIDEAAKSGRKVGPSPASRLSVVVSDGGASTASAGAAAAATTPVGASGPKPPLGGGSQPTTPTAKRRSVAIAEAAAKGTSPPSSTPIGLAARRTGSSGSLPAEPPQKSPALIKQLAVSTARRPSSIARRRNRSMRVQHRVPKVVLRMIDYLEQRAMDQVGLFRVAGSAAEIKALKRDIDDGKDVQFHSVQDHNVVANVLKQYLRNLPDPLLTFKLYDEFIAVHDIKETPAKIEAVRKLVQQLPFVNRVFLQEILMFLCRVSRRHATNKMTASNLAIVFGPNLLRPKAESMATLMHAAPINNVTQLLIEEYSAIFEHSTDAAQEGNALGAQELTEEDLSCFPMVEYASEHFQAHWTSGFRRKRIDTKLLIVYSKDMLQAPLHRLEGDLVKEAVEVQKTICKYTGEMSSKQNPLLLARHLVHTALAHVDLRDEIYAQMCRHVQNNPHSISRSKGWELLIVLVGIVLPTDGFLNYFRNFLQCHTYTNDAAFAERCAERLRATYRNGPRCHGLSRMELDATKMKQPVRFAGKLSDGTVLNLESDSTTIVAEMTQAVTKAHGYLEGQAYGWYLVLDDVGLDFHVREHEHVLDVLRYAETSAAVAEKVGSGKGSSAFGLGLSSTGSLQSAGGTTTSSMSGSMSLPQFTNKEPVHVKHHFELRKRVFALDGNLPVVESASENDLVRLVFHQVRTQFIVGQLPVENTDDVVEMAAAELSVTKGAYDKAAYAKLDVTDGLLPAVSFNKQSPAKWKEAIESVYASLSAKKQRSECMHYFLKVASRQPLYGASLFPVEQSYDDNIPAKLFMAISCRGVSMLDVTTMTEVAFFGMSWIVEGKASINSESFDLVVKTSVVSEDVKVVSVRTTRADEAEDLFRGCQELLQTGAKFARALFDYSVEDESLLSFQRNDLILIRENDGSGWLSGSIGDGPSSWFPDDYVRLLVSTDQLTDAERAMYKEYVDEEKPRTPPPAWAPGSAVKIERTPTKELTVPDNVSSVRRRSRDELRKFRSITGPKRPRARSPKRDGEDVPLPKVPVTAFEPLAKSLRSKKSTIEQQLQFSKDPVKKTILALESADLQDLARESFLLVMQYMGDYPNPNTSVAAVQDLARIGLDTPAIRSELYLQVVKQMTGNPRAESVHRGWHLIAVLVGLFAGGKDLMQALRGYLQEATKLGDTVSLWATYCASRLRRTQSSGARTFPPPTVEIEAVRERKMVTLRINFLDDTSKTLMMDSATTAKEAVSLVARSMSLKDSSGYAIYQRLRDTEWGLRDNMHLMDVIAKSEKLDTMLSASSDWSFYFKKRLFVAGPAVPSDSVAVHQLYYQGLTDFVQGKLPVKVEDALDLAAHQLVVELFGLEMSPEDAISSMLTEVHAFIPQNLIGSKSLDQWRTAIRQAHTAHQAESVLDAQRRYLEILSRWRFFGSQLFFVTQTAQPSLPESLLLGINRDGCHLFEHGEVEPALSVLFENISNWGASNDQFQFQYGNIMEQSRLVVYADRLQCEDMAHLLQTYFDLPRRRD